MSALGRHLKIRLEFDGATVSECLFSEMPDEALVGRSEDCFWRIPASDRSASGHHAKIVKKGRQLVLFDTESRNGVYYMGHTIAERRMAAGDIYGVGDAKLVVERKVETLEPSAKYHVLEQLSGETRGRLIRLEKPVTTVGSAPTCDIRLPDSLVSQVHATFEVRDDGYCYLRDNKSRNGTKINGVRQGEEASQTGQMLKDGDVISIAYADFRFWDRNVQHVRANVLLKLLVVGVTLAVALGGYFCIQSFFPTAKALRLRAEALAEKALFGQARELLAAAAEARGSELDVQQRSELIHRLNLWETTDRSWREICAQLESPGVKYMEVNEKFASLLMADDENWKWNATDALEQMKLARATQEMLGLYLAGRDRLGDAESDMEALAEIAASSERILSMKADASFQRGVFADLKDVANEIRLTVADWKAVQDVMDGYRSVADTDRVFSRLQELLSANATRVKARRSKGLPASEAVGRLCKAICVPLAALRIAKGELEENYRTLSRLEFGALRPDLSVPSAADCNVSANLSTRRADLMTENAQLCRMARQLDSYRNYLRGQKVFPDGKGNPDLAAVFDSEVRSHALACDCLSKPQPGYSVKVPTSDFDRLLGVNVLFAYLNDLDGDFDTAVFDERFRPAAFGTAEILRALAQYVRFCSAENERSPFSAEMTRLRSFDGTGCAFVTELKQAEAILLRREKLLEDLRAVHSAERTGRRGLIAGALAVILESSDGESAEKRRRELSKDFRTYRKNLASCASPAGSISPERQLKIEEQLLREGIPGDPLLKQPWSDAMRRAAK